MVVLAKPSVGALIFLGAALAMARAHAEPAPPPDLRGPEDVTDAQRELTPPTAEAAPADLAAPPSADQAPAAPAKRRPKPKLRGALPEVASEPGALPPVVPYPAAARIGKKGGPTVIPGETGPTVAAEPVPERRPPPKREDKPFDPVGVYVGNLRLTPYVEQSLGYASNPLGVAGASRGSLASLTEIGVGLQSDWSHDALSGALHLGYGAYPQVSAASAPYGSGLVDYRLDASRDTSFDVEGRYNLGTETYSQLGLGGGSQKLALVSTYGATLGANQKFGDLTLGLHGLVDRQQYSGGTLSSDDYTDYAVKLRAAYRLSEAVSPYVEAAADTRAYDSGLDSAGYDRASQGYSGKAGVKLAFSEMLTGDASLGYGQRDYHDSRLPNVGAPLVDASLVWSATPLTTVTLKTATQLQDAVVAGASADVNRSYTLGVDHAFTERLKLGILGGFSTDHYVGIHQDDHSYNIGVNGEYHLSREVVLKASYTHQQFVSNVSGANYNSDTALVGVRLQR